MFYISFFPLTSIRGISNAYRHRAYFISTVDPSYGIFADRLNTRGLVDEYPNGKRHRNNSVFCFRHFQSWMDPPPDVSSLQESITLSKDQLKGIERKGQRLHVF